MPNRYIDDTLTVGDLPDIPEFVTWTNVTATTWTEESQEVICDEPEEVPISISFEEHMRRMRHIHTPPQPLCYKEPIEDKKEWKCVNKDREKVMF